VAHRKPFGTLMVRHLVYLASSITELSALLLDMYSLVHMTEDEWHEWGRYGYDWYLDIDPSEDEVDKKTA